jgi:ATP-dependent Clp protease ATP-binding subunit ClpC
MEQKESEKLLNLEIELQDSVIGQGEAVSAISKALRRSRADLKDPRRPIGSFLFMGPTGVGKTHLAKTLAESIFGDREAIVQIDMSEYLEKFSVSRLIGSPPGYIGYEEGGQLTETVRRKPYCVVLFDEIEKAHPDVVQLLLQVLEEGRLTDSLGRTVDFRNTILIMTSNVGAHILQKGLGLGFGSDDEEDNFDTTRRKILDEAKKVFKPEFLNRINSLIVFRQLQRRDLRKIIEIELGYLRTRLEDKKISLDVSNEAKDYLIDQGYDEKFGARPLRRAVEQHVEDPLAESLLRGEIKEGEPLLVLLNPDGPGLVFRQEEPATGSGVSE